MIILFKCSHLCLWPNISNDTKVLVVEMVVVLGRFKVFGPDGSNYWVTHEAHVGGSDPDDV